MFLSAIAKPDASKNFNGKIGIWRVCEPYKAKRDSKNYDKSQVYDKDIYMTADILRKICTQKVFKRIRE
jgi:DNA modification methylase